jgi:DNA-binding NarL/FixJ family response regulator
MRARVTVGIVDDHPAIAAGVPAGLSSLLPLAPGSPVASTVSELIERVDHLDVVLLDVRLGDDSSPPDNVRRLVERGWAVLLYTQVRQPPVVAACLRAGACGVVGKHEPWTVLAEAVRTAADGEDLLNADWASAGAALEDGPTLAPRERQVLGLYAAGLPLKSVARRVGVAEETAKEYLARVKRKYLEAGRPARTRSELYRRAVEDGVVPSPGDV